MKELVQAVVDLLSVRDEPDSPEAMHAATERLRALVNRK
jgi:hypothetical protein